MDDFNMTSAAGTTTTGNQNIFLRTVPTILVGMGLFIVVAALGSVAFILPYLMIVTRRKKEPQPEKIRIKPTPNEDEEVESLRIN